MDNLHTLFVSYAQLVKRLVFVVEIELLLRVKHRIHNNWTIVHHEGLQSHRVAQRDTLRVHAGLSSFRFHLGNLAIHFHDWNKEDHLFI